MSHNTHGLHAADILYRTASSAMTAEEVDLLIEILNTIESEFAKYEPNQDKARYQHYRERIATRKAILATRARKSP